MENCGDTVKPHHKSAAKSAAGGQRPDGLPVGAPFTGKEDPRNGRGPAPGAANAGRPRSAVRLAAQERSEGLLHHLVAIAEDPTEKAADRIRAIEVIGRWAGVEKMAMGFDGNDEDDSNEHGVVEMPPLDPRPSMEMRVPTRVAPPLDKTKDAIHQRSG